jgi:hypothetical protein
MKKQRARPVHLNLQMLAAMGGATAAGLFVICWLLVSLMGTTADIYVQLLTSIELASTPALIQGAAVSFAIGSLVGGATAWICNRLRLLVEPENCND